MFIQTAILRESDHCGIEILEDEHVRVVSLRENQTIVGLKCIMGVDSFAKTAGENQTIVGLKFSSMVSMIGLSFSRESDHCGIEI